MTYQTVTFKEKKYNIDDDKTAKNLTQMQEREIEKLNILINDYKHLIEVNEKAILKMQRVITNYETNFIEYYKYEELQNDYINLVQVLNNKNKGVK